MATKRKAGDQPTTPNKATGDPAMHKQRKLSALADDDDEEDKENRSDIVEDGMDEMLGEMDLDDWSEADFKPSKTAAEADAIADAEAMFADGSDAEDDAMLAGLDQPPALDLSEWTRCTVQSIERQPDGSVQLGLTADGVQPAKSGSCALLGAWTSCPLAERDTISLQAFWCERRRSYCVDMQRGLLIVCPDQLISGTTVTSAVFCQRRAILAERYPGLEGANKVMLIGTLVHELFQAVIRDNGEKSCGRTIDGQDIERIAAQMLASSDMLLSLYETGLGLHEVHDELAKFVPHIVQFVRKYLKSSTGVSSNAASEEFAGRIERVLDIEENVWIPAMGVKGKIDATVAIRRPTRGARREIMPLEVKTGKPTFSAEHRGQVSLYQMMMVASGRVDVRSGLLLYLRDGLMREVSVARNDQRDLIMLRNQIAHYAANSVGEIGDQASAETRRVFGKRVARSFAAAALPEPINHHSACGRCPYNVLCGALLQRDPDTLDQMSDGHPLRAVWAECGQHLNAGHIEYFVHWSGVLALEERSCRRDRTDVSSLWTVRPEDRAKEGRALVDLRVVGEPVREFHTFTHRFEAAATAKDDEDAPNLRLFSEGDYLRVSTRQRVAVAAGRVTAVTSDSISMRLERNLAKTHPQARFILDTCDSQTIMRNNAANLGRLLDDTPVTNRLRALIVDRVRPDFEPAGREPETGEDLLRTLNDEQRGAVLKALRARDYMLLRGLPGTGKTQTIAVLVLLLVQRGKRVLVTSHTHSAVDTVLMRVVAVGGERLPDILRLGDESRMHESIRRFGQKQQLADCKTADELRHAYAKFSIVGVSCLGANHAMLAQNHFDVCIVDEATQVWQTTVLRPLFAAGRFVLIGDPDQLPPVVRSREARRMGADESLFVRLACDDGDGGSDVGNREAIVSLTKQYRMNATITRLANALTYAGALQCGSQQVADSKLSVDESAFEGTREWLRCVLDVRQERSVVLVETGNVSERNEKSTGMFVGSGQKKPDSSRRVYANYCEAAVVRALINELLTAKFPAAQIGVIAPYSAQVELLRRSLADCAPDVDVNTVDQFQGRDKQVIVVSCTKCDRPGTAEQPRRDDGESFEILADLRRLTVAITRAKHKLIVVGDVDSLRSYEPFAKLFAAVADEHRMRLADEATDFAWTEVLHVLHSSLRAVDGNE